MEQNNDENPPGKKRAYDDSGQGTERTVMRKEITNAVPSGDDEKRLDEDIHKLIVTRENAEQLAENLAGHLTSEITGFAGMMKASQLNMRLVEEKMSRLSRDMEDIRKGGTTKAFDERVSKLEALCNVINEKLSKQEDICSTLNRMVHSEHDELTEVLNEKMSRQDELGRSLNERVLALDKKASTQEALGRAVMAVLNDFKAGMADYPTKSEIDPLWKEAETVILDGMNRQRGDLKALIAALDEDYKDGAISEKTYRETKEKTEEKISAIEDKLKTFVEAAANRVRAAAERPAAPTTEKEKLAEAKMADVMKREERIYLLEKKLGDTSQQVSSLAQSAPGMMAEFEKKLDDSAKLASGRMAEFEKKISDVSRKDDGTERFSRLEKRMGELAGRIEELRTALDEGLRGEKKRQMPQPPEAREQLRQRGPASGGFLGRIFGIERESGEIAPMTTDMTMAAPTVGKMPEPEKIKIELEAPPAPAIMPPLPPYGPEKKKEKHLKAELESLESMLGRLKEQRQKAGGHGDARSKLMGQRAELEGLLKMVEKKHAEGAIENSSYADIRQRTLERLSKINELLSLGQNK